MPQELIDAEEELKYKKQHFGNRDFLKMVICQTKIEKESIDFRKPFNLFCGQVRIGLGERLNVLERETVQRYRKGLNLA